ncbi:hypothetical protein QIH87_47560 [Bradyrhizobium elkanii]|uniref:hypothetical protein n=1 Tax=Bradyrhizobium elkanii TaxID=29448 RepID=UPI0027144FCB|nr:hypothetical protein [Bradyrhizobium elkanii]WLB09508.1 hypothetical protein QIH87_47560 [Bradyrhizobium elkanii]WLB72545.1 hypothetical protein QIH89_00765 [Bradyrhizobium elkanii]
MASGTNTGKKIKGPETGLRQARRLCQLNHRRRLEFLAEGLPIILRSAEGFWQSSQQLRQSHGREAKVLEGFAQEEAAKILILMDAVRCPPKLIASKLNRIVGWFYDHLARLIYAEAVSWKPMHLAQLRDYVDQQRRGHYLEGRAGEYIMPNWTIYKRESRLYVDIEAYQDDALNWNVPHDPYTGLPFLDDFMPPALRIAAAMEQVGMFTVKGLQAVSDIWGSLEYREKEDHHDGNKLTERLLHRLHAEGLMLESAQEDDFATLYRDWQIPMYDLDFSLIPVTLEELEAAQEREYWSMVGDPRY